MIRLSPQMLNTEVDVVSPTEGTDAYGNTTIDFTTPTTRTLVAHVQPGTVDEVTASRLATEVTATLFTREPIAARDRVLHGGETWEVDGPSKDWGPYAITTLVLRKG